MAITITLAQLTKAQACTKQVELFRETFGEQVTFDTLDAFVSACQAHPFDYEWAAGSLLRPLTLADYYRAIEPARADYARARAQAWDDLERAVAPARADYERATASARANYKRARAAALVDYKHACAPAFANAYWAQEAPLCEPATQ